MGRVERKAGGVTVEGVREKGLVVHPLVQGVLMMVLSRGDLVPEFQRKLAPEWLGDLAGAGLLEKIFEAHSNDEWSNPTSLSNATVEEQNYLAGLIGEQLDFLVEMSSVDRVKSVDDLVRRVEVDYLGRKISILNQRLKGEGASGEEKARWTGELMHFLERKRQLTKV